MPRRYLATYEYTEMVHGEPREFVHETIFEADDEFAAHEQALRYFDELAQKSLVGWKRVLKSCAVAAAPIGATAKGGRRVHRPPEIET